ncbi:MAG: hypothetical protein L3J76_02670, partial [Candidatus Hydrothermae bacterium]|nr:hypothetical protein [Candidatus Hydrothermae bacterium]
LEKEELYREMPDRTLPLDGGGSGWGWTCGEVCIVQRSLNLAARMSSILLDRRAPGSMRVDAEGGPERSLYSTAFPV